MTLYKQIVIGMIGLFILLISAVFIIELQTSRDNLEQQQITEVTNAINTAGLALAPYLEQQEDVAAESVINALFDGSTYAQVKLSFFDHRKPIVRVYPVAPSRVPQWFTQLNLFKPIDEKRVITSGWMQLAQIEITSHPGEAYQQLWDVLTRLCVVFLCVFVISLIAIAWIIRHALKPLHTIVNKMEQVARSQFGKPLPKPSTKDLECLVDGINRMSLQVEKAFQAQASEAQQLRERAFLDHVSKLGNRAYFMNQLNSWLAEGGFGVTGLLHTTFIETIYESDGYEAGDHQIRLLANQLTALIHVPDACIARLSECEFAFIFPNIEEEEEIHRIAENIITSVSDIAPDPMGVMLPESYLGILTNQSVKTSSEILSLLDNAISSAKANPELPYYLMKPTDNNLIMGKKQWRNLVNEAMEKDLILFRFQAARDSQGHIFHKEIFSSIEKDDQHYSAIQYLFALEQLGVSYIFDEYVIQYVIDYLRRSEDKDVIAINIAASSIAEPGFVRFVSEILGNNPDLAPQIHFELPEVCFIQSPHHTSYLCHAIHQAGADFGVDQYGRNFKSLSYLNEFRPKYVKLDYLYTFNLDDEKQTYTLASISRTAHNLDITTIASRVETQQQLEFLSEHFIDVFQGFIVDE